MADTVQSVDYYYATVNDEPGAGLRVLSALKEAGVNLVAYLGFPSREGRSQIDLVPEDARALTRAAAEAGISLTGPKRGFLCQGDDRVGAVADVNSKLAQANINITASTAVAAGGGRYGMLLWVAQADHDRAAKVLGA